MGLSGSKPVSSHLEANLKLTSVEYDTHVQDCRLSKDKPLADIGKYQRLVGSLLYLTMTMVDIVFVVQVLSQYINTPKDSHMEIALRVVRYIKSAPGLGLFMSSQNSNELYVFYDSDCGSCLQNIRSVKGYLVKF